MSQDNNQNQNNNMGNPSPYPYQNNYPQNQAQGQNPYAPNPYSVPQTQTAPQPTPYQQPVKEQTQQPYSPFNQQEIQNNPFQSQTEPSINPYYNQAPQQAPQQVYNTQPNMQGVVPTAPAFPHPQTASFNHLNELHEHPVQAEPVQFQAVQVAPQPEVMAANFEENPLKPEPTTVETANTDKTAAKLAKVKGKAPILAIILVILFAGLAGGAGYYAYSLYGQNQNLTSEISALKEARAPITLQTTIERLEAQYNQAQLDLAAAQRVNAEQAEQINSLEEQTGVVADKIVTLEEAQVIALRSVDKGVVTNSAETTDFEAKWLIEITSPSSDGTQNMVTNIYLNTTGKVIKVVAVKGIEIQPAT